MRGPIHLPSREVARRHLFKQDRDLVAKEHFPARFLEQPLGQTSIGTHPDHLDLVAIADRIPDRATVQHIAVFENPVLAVNLESIVEIRPSRWLAFGRDQATPILLVKKLGRGRLMIEGLECAERPSREIAWGSSGLGSSSELT